MPGSKDSSKLEPLWQCPKCGKKFNAKRMWHSFKVYTLEPLFAKCEPQVRQLYEKFEAMVKACGPVIIEPKRTGVAFQVRVRAIGCVPRRSYLQIVFAFERPQQHPRLVKVLAYSGRFYGHWIDFRAESELDSEVERWVREV